MTRKSMEMFMKMVALFDKACDNEHTISEKAKTVGAPVDIYMHWVERGNEIIAEENNESKRKAFITGLQKRLDEMGAYVRDYYPEADYFNVATFIDSPGRGHIYMSNEKYIGQTIFFDDDLDENDDDDDDNEEVD